MSDFLLDTTVFIDWWRGHTEANRIVHDIALGQISASFSAITYTELFQFGDISRKQEIELLRLAQLMEEVPITGEIAAIAGRMLRDLSRGERRRLNIDALIAATVVVRGEKVITRNVRDLERFYSEIESY